ncbi:unnamed protein product [Linum tenue]|uniref:Uncharacterized protein n=2 Tax=Linum tenue TaxID=586396 RepID=A0AAV0QZI6_9ROSI|nr:unnamed protein product [Linum tenue]
MLELIDDIQRSGLTHRFETDIQKALEKIVCFDKCYTMKNNSLHEVGLHFRLLRQNDCVVSQDVFKKFVSDKGEIIIKGCCNGHEDLKDILSLYEASHLAYEGEDILDKAKTHTTKYLKNILLEMDSSDNYEFMKELIRHSLEIPLHRRMVMLEARWYIESCKKKEGTNMTLLELAKLEFNMAQSVLQQDLKSVSWWWNNLGLAKELSFSRDRLVECFFVAVSLMYEPQFSSYRQGLTKVASFITTIDDIYDIYGTMSELELFTDAVERWDIDVVQSLPNYMKICFLALYNTINEMAYGFLRKHEHNIIPNLAKLWADMLKAFLKEAKWSHKEIDPPTFSEYLENAWRSVSGTVILVHTYYLLDGDENMNDFDSTKKTLLQLMTYDKILRWPSIIFRLCNDLATSSEEIARGGTVNSISCYMNDNGVNEEQARQHIKVLIDGAWKKMNQELFFITKDTIGSNAFMKSFLQSTINLARMAHCIYHRGDSHSSPDPKSKKEVLTLIVEPITD